MFFSHPQVSSALLLSPVERLSRTQGLWLLNNVTREEATRLLGDKEKGVSTSYLLLSSSVISFFARISLSVKVRSQGQKLSA